MNYEEFNKSCFEEAKKLYQTANADQRYVLESLFPELKESKDERIRKALIQYISELNQDVVHLHPGIETCNEWIAWLDKQGEKESVTCPICGWEIEKQGEQKEINLVEILKHYPKETKLYSPLYGKLWLAEVDEENEIITCYKHPLNKDCTRAILEQEDTVSFYSDGTTGLPDFSVSKDCMLFLYDIEKQGDQKTSNKVEPKFKIGNVISNGKVIYRVDNITKNCLGQDCYFLVNIESERDGTRYLILYDSHGKTSHMGEITWLCEQVDKLFNIKED